MKGFLVGLLMFCSIGIANAQYDQSPAPSGYVLVQCDWNYYTQWFMKTYYSPSENRYTWRFHFFCELLGTNARDIDPGNDPGGASPAYSDQEAYGDSGPSQPDTDGGGYSGDIGGESNCCGEEL